MQTSLAVTHRRIPAPFNLIQVGVGFVVDGLQECSWHYKRFNRCRGTSTCRYIYLEAWVPLFRPSAGGLVGPDWLDLLYLCLKLPRGLVSGHVQNKVRIFLGFFNIYLQSVKL